MVTPFPILRLHSLDGCFRFPQAGARCPVGSPDSLGIFLGVDHEWISRFFRHFRTSCKKSAKPLNFSAAAASNLANGDSLSRSPSLSLDGQSGSPKPELVARWIPPIHWAIFCPQPFAKPRSGRANSAAALATMSFFEDFQHLAVFRCNTLELTGPGPI